MAKFENLKKKFFGQKNFFSDDVMFLLNDPSSRSHNLVQEVDTDLQFFLLISYCSKYYSERVLTKSLEQFFCNSGKTPFLGIFTQLLNEPGPNSKIRLCHFSPIIVYNTCAKFQKNP